MEIKLSKIEMGVENMAHYKGAVLYAKVKGEQPMIADLDNLVNAIVEDDRNEGIIFVGDWSSQVLDMIEILKAIKNTNLKVTIYTEHSLEIFKVIIGITCEEKIKGKRVKKKYIQNNLGKFELIGSLMLDELIKDDYYILVKTGEDIIVYRIKKEGDENDNGISK